MYNLIRADIYKIFKSSAIIILFALALACAVVMAIMTYYIPLGKIDSSLYGLAFLFSDINVFTILGAVCAAVYICNDFDNRTIHDSVATGCHRSTVVVSKAVSFFVAAAFVMLSYVIVTAAALCTGCKFSINSAQEAGFLSILVSECGKTFTGGEILKLIVLMITALIVYTAQMSICVPLSFIFKKPVPVIAIYYAISVLSGQLAKIAANFTAFDKVMSFTPFKGGYYFLTPATANSTIAKAIGASLLFTTVMIAAAYGVFRKTEIK